MAHQCFKLLERENKRFLSVSDILHVYWRKWLRLAPMYYLVLFAGWALCSRLSDGPIWSMTNGDWYNCSSVWWQKLLFVGNLIGF